MTYKILILIAKRLFHTFSFHGSFFKLYFTASATAQPIINIYLSVHQKKEICEIFYRYRQHKQQVEPQIKYVVENFEILFCTLFKNDEQSSIP
jgi:hypothetical protein